MGKKKSYMLLMSPSVPISRPVTVPRKARREGCITNHSQMSSRDKKSPEQPGPPKARTKVPDHLCQIWIKSHSLFVW